jgi:pectate lyase
VAHRLRTVLAGITLVGAIAGCTTEFPERPTARPADTGVEQDATEGLDTGDDAGETPAPDVGPDVPVTDSGGIDIPDTAVPTDDTSDDPPTDPQTDPDTPDAVDTPDVPDAPDGPCARAVAEGWEVCEESDEFCEVANAEATSCGEVCQALGMNCLGSAQTAAPYCVRDRDLEPECDQTTHGIFCRCGTCERQCDDRVCGRDGCGGECGPGCEDTQFCSGGRCEEGCTPQCMDRNCGSDGCDGDCGTCDDGFACDLPSGRCDRICEPSCPVDSCGPDGCGGMCTCSNENVCTDGVCTPATRVHESVLDNIVGFGAQTMGGAGYPICTVTTTAESGDGSLAWCLQNPGVWVRFAASGEYAVTDYVNVPSYTTIDGRGVEVVFTGYGFRIADVRHVVIHNIEVARPSHSEEAITIRDEAQFVWIDHVTVRGYEDDNVEIADNSTDITVARCLFDTDEEVIAVGHSSFNDSINSRVTLHHSHAMRFDGRAPRLKWGKMHAFNNVFQGWDEAAMIITDAAEMLVENNIFTESTDERVLITTYSDYGLGYARATGNRIDEGMTIEEHMPQLVFVASDYYDYALDLPDTDMRLDVVSNAGRQVVPWPLQD